MRRPGAIGVVLALFLVGVAVGALGADLWSAHRRAARVGGGGPGGPGGATGRFSAQASQELEKRLDLTADQRRQVDGILADAHRQAEAILNDLRPRLVGIVESANDRIETILTPQQKEEFARYRAERRQHRHSLLHGMHAMHPPPAAAAH